LQSWYGTWRVFRVKDEVDLLRIKEIFVHAKNVAVTQMALDFDFRMKLVLDSSFLQLRLLKDFDGKNIFGSLLPRAR
jgi:hypothetical protein